VVPAPRRCHHWNSGYLSNVIFNTALRNPINLSETTPSSAVLCNNFENLAP
jgi:hypothetical protein